jgi:catechol 2,3-dioxygenase-like lactoylglutathione lyase family enzyme
MIHAINHFTIRAEDRDATLGYYCGLLGLNVGPRPPFDFPGAWLYAGGRPILHVIFGRELPAERTGVIDHLAFSASGLRDVKARLGAAGVAYELRRLPGGRDWQLFSHDPNGARVELDFDATEEA